MKSIQATNQTINSESDSELSTVSSSRFSGLEEDWWKEKSSGSSYITAAMLRRLLSGGLRYQDST
jgi:hypothetical protein